MKKEQKKDFLIKKMLEAKGIEIDNKNKMVIFKIKNIFSKPKKTKKERLTALKKSLEKKEIEELEYMIANKEKSLVLLEKRLKSKTKKAKIKEMIKLAKEIKKKEGKRERIGREVGFRKKEITELEKALKEKERKLLKKEVKIIKKERALEKTEREIEEEETEEPVRKKRFIRKGKRKKIKEKIIKKKIKRKFRLKKKTGKKEIGFISPEREMKKKREKHVGKIRKKAIESFHQEFTSGKEKTLVSIKGDTQIITGTPGGRAEPGIKPADIRKAEKRKAEEIEFEMQKTKEKIKNLKSAFFHRQINEEDYKKKSFEYKEQLHSLEMEKKRPSTARAETKGTGVEKAAKSAAEKTGVREIKAKPGLKTVQEEMQQGAIQHSPKSKERVQQALQQFHQEFTAQPLFRKGGGVYKIETPEELGPIKPTGIVKRIAPETTKTKEMQMERKIRFLMKKNNIPASQIRREFEFVSEKDLMKRFDRILDVIERKYAQKPEQIKDKIFKEGALLMEKKPKEKPKKVKVKEILEKKIVTDFDKVLQIVQEKGKVNERDAAKLLKIKPGRIKECYAVLEKNDLIKVDYPVFGGAKLISKDYVKPKKKKKEKKKKKDKKKSVVK